MTGLRIAPDFELPLEAVTEKFAILAKAGAGKSNAAVVMAEEMYDHGLPWVAIDPKGDWWGIRAAGDGTAPGLAVLVFGGLHGDVPLEPTAGRLVADLVVEERLTCVLDVSEFTKADQRRFLIDFADRLYRTNTEPLHVFCEEADEYIPQRVMGENAKLVGVFETLVKRGRFRGIGITLVTQRSASLNKDVLTQIETLIPMRTPSPQDRKAILAWVDYHDVGREAVDSLPGLDSGEAWVFSPQWLNTLTRIRFRRRRTFDSGATPKVGQKPRQPTTLAEVDLAAIKEAMAETIEKAKAEDPKELRKLLAQLERDLLDERAKPTPEPIVDRVEVPVVEQMHIDAFRNVVDRMLEVLEDIDVRLHQYPNELPTEGKQGQPTTRRSAPRANQASSNTGRAPVAGPSTTERKNPPAARETRPDAAGGLPKAQGILLTVLVQHGTLTFVRLALLSGYSSKSSGFKNALGALRSAGYAVGGKEAISATELGAEVLGPVDPPPAGRELVDHWMSNLGKAEKTLLEQLLDVWPEHLTFEDLAAASGRSPLSSGYKNALGRLRTLQLAHGGRDAIYAADELGEASQ